MKIVILGAGKMGSFFADVLSFDHEICPIRHRPSSTEIRIQHFANDPARRNTRFYAPT